MRIAATIVGTTRGRFRLVESNAERIALARRVASACREELAADLVVLPAGFLAVRRASEVGAVAAQLASAFPDGALLAGIDLDVDGRENAKKGAKRAAGLGYWGFAASDGELLGGPWQQRGVYPGDVIDDLSARVVELRRRRVGVLLCGELYNRALRPALGAARPDLVVDLGHLSMGRGFSRTLPSTAKAAGAPVFHAQHVVAHRRGAVKWSATAKGARSTRDVDWTSYRGRDDEPWAEVKVWELATAARV